MARNPGRPLSPHLGIWKWGPHMLVSILHRATGSAMAIGGGLIFLWWLAAAATGAEAYATFHYYVFDASDGATGGVIVNILARVAAVGLTWTFLQHLFSGLRHLMLDIGAGYELKTNRTGAILTIAASLFLTALIWVPLFWRH